MRIWSHIRVSALAGTTFWLPFLAGSFIAARHPDWNSVRTLATLNIPPAIGLMAFVILRRRRPIAQWLWGLGGIYVSGPLAMIIGAGFSNGGVVNGDRAEKLFLLTFSLLPPLTLWLAFLNGVAAVVLVATGVLLARVMNEERAEKRVAASDATAAGCSSAR